MQFKEEKYLGIPFKMYGNDLEGLDCTNLVSLIAKERGIFFPNINHFNYTEQDSYKGIKKTRNDLNLFNKISIKDNKKDSVVVIKINGIAGHVGYMLDENYFIHVLPKRNVTIENINSLLWRNNIVGFYTYIGSEEVLDV